jgi:uncharacterized protein (TIGR02217 family)
MPALVAFHETRFPTKIALGATGGPERVTEIIALGQGHEVRNARFADSRRRYDAGTGIRTIEDLQEVVRFFEERRGRLHGFRYRDPLDYRSGGHATAITAFDQLLGSGDGEVGSFDLVKTYGVGSVAYRRRIAKPVPGTVRVAVGDAEKTIGTHVTVDTTTGTLTFAPGHVPPAGAPVTAGFAFDVPVRFDTDRLMIDLSHFAAGHIPSIPLVEIRP